MWHCQDNEVWFGVDCSSSCNDCTDYKASDIDSLRHYILAMAGRAGIIDKTARATMTRDPTREIIVKPRRIIPQHILCDCLARLTVDHEMDQVLV